ncbi:Excinuclease ABC subunit C [Anaerohalosphaera lusitana]|uniref:Excinuclease ABC subunit C n=1 Tax=Anaerohalosphaera lusitana TaxID=1936003 RepID=A0A1U9NM28_9BACT|nr:hypothetical protein [Anaerohalosphaera lusitana]AQT68556.1 Excinuclease ABC subunit C [Anaerohalosphaera lusitana]
MLDELFDGCLQLDTSEQTAVFFDQLKELPACKGIICFANGQGQAIKLQIAGDIRRQARAKLVSSDDEEEITKTPDISPVTDKVYYTCCYNDFRAMLYYYLSARTIFPDEYRSLVALPKQTYASVGLDFIWPYFATSTSPIAQDKQKVFGPFPSRRAANDFVQILNEVFCLCRRPDLIREGSHKTCPYLQMHTCPAPCDGRISADDYRESVDKAIRTASGGLDGVVKEFESLMREQSKRLEFEQAADCKKKLGKLEQLKKADYQWVNDTEKLAVLHVDRSARVAVEGSKKKVQTYSAFLVRLDRTVEFSDFLLSDELGELENLEAEVSKQTPVEDSRQANERIGILSYFLFRSKKKGLWLDCSRGIPDVGIIKATIESELAEAD